MNTHTVNATAAPRRGALTPSRVIIAWLLAAVLGACNTAPHRSSDSAAATAALQTAEPQSPEDSLRAAADLARITGDSAAPLWLIIASDFQCPYCAQWHRESHDSLRQAYVQTGRVRIAYLNFPLEQHQHARLAADAALCAGAQNRFWPLHDAMFETQEQWGPLPSAEFFFDSLAAVTGVDGPTWRNCMATGVMDAVVRADRDRAASAGVRSTPTFLVLPARPPGTPGQLIRGAVPLVELKKVLDSLLSTLPGT